METGINVTAILKDKPQGVKLYSRICGAVELKEVLDVRKKKSIVVKELNSSNQHRFWYDGKFFRAGQCVLQPSKEMAYWSKFSWKKGDVLVCKDVNSHIIFEAFNDDTYTTFTGKLNYQATKAGYSFAHTRNIAMTQDFDIEKGDAAQTYINTIEELLGGKLNLETLEIEKPEFKDGDILSIQEDEEHYHAILIFKGGTDVYVYFDYFHRVLTYGTKIDENEKYISHLATDEEKQQLFSALKKENKSWDADKKMFVDLKPKVELKPFDKVLVRDNEDDIWEVSLFGYKDDELYYRCDNGIQWIQCIPYDGNEHLLGTTNNVEG